MEASGHDVEENWGSSSGEHTTEVSKQVLKKLTRFPGEKKSQEMVIKTELGKFFG